MNKKADAVIVAAGCGKRSGLSVPKQFFEISGRPVLSYTVTEFESYDNIGAIIVVLPSEDFEKHKAYMKKFNPDVIYVPGGETRMQSVYNGLKKLEEAEHAGIVCVHDGVRPYITNEIVSDSIEVAEKYGAALTAIPITDTVKCVEDGVVMSTVNRDKLYAAQTPQTFRFDIIMPAYEKAMQEDTVFTDESAVVENYGVKVHISKGLRINEKLTMPEDFKYFK